MWNSLQSKQWPQNVYEYIHLQALDKLKTDKTAKKNCNKKPTTVSNPFLNVAKHPSNIQRKIYKN